MQRDQTRYPVDLNEMEQWVRAHLLPGQRILEIGCGDGVLIEGLAADSEAGFVAVGADPHSVASSVVRAQTFESLEEDPFDVIFASMSLHHLADRAASVDALQRLSRPGTMLLIRDFDWTEIDEPTNRWWFNHRIQRQQPDDGQHQLVGTFEEYLAGWKAQMAHHVMSWAEVKSMLEDARFETVSEMSVTSLFHHALGEDLRDEEERLTAEGKIRLVGRRWEGRRHG